MLIRYPKVKSSLSLYTPTEVSRALRRVYSASRSHLAPLVLDDLQKNKGVDTDELPDADLGDFDSPRLGMKSLKVTRSLQLPKLPPIPKPADPQFKSILLKKLDLCKQLCDFDNPLNDRQAKDIKRHTLNEINNLFTTLGLNAIIDDEVKDIIMDVIKVNLLRPLSKLDELSLFNPDVGAFKEFDFDHTQYIYRMLTIFVHDLPKYKGFSINLLYQLLPVLSSKDKRERESLISFFVTLINSKPVMFPELFPKLIKILDNDSNTPDPCGIYSALSIIYTCHNANNNLKDIIKPYYRSHFLPLIRHEHFSIFSFPLLQLYRLFFANNYTNSNDFVRLLINIWPVSHPAKEEMMITFLVQSLEFCRNIDYYLLGRAITKLAISADSPSFKVAEQANKALTSPIVLDLVTQTSHKIIPKLIKHIENARSHWSNTVRTAAEDSMAAITRVLGRNVNKNKLANINTSKDKLKSWAAIARAAAIKDKNIYLSEKLGELSKLFTDNGTPQAQHSNPKAVKSSNTMF